ncbi:MAG: hypothetical protein NZM31_12700 [Gemmatales bacterium]|nr:hypothetical protein [Gemmatales bacterium]MDW8387854.1 hypothetical protein [Gemmatales bacterium]
METIRGHVKAIIAAKRLGTSVPASTAGWLESLDAVLRRRLACCGLADGPTDVPTLAEWCQRYIASRTDAAPRTRYRLELVAKLLCEFFGADRRLGSINNFDAECFTAWPRTQALAPSTVAKRLAFARTFLHVARKHRFISENPFCEVRIPRADVTARQH